MEIGNKAAVLQAILFTAGEPLGAEEVLRGLEWTQEEYRQAVRELEEYLACMQSGLQLRYIGDRIQLVTRPEFAEAVRNVLSPVVKKPLSQSVLETLSIIAYKQPVTKAEIEAIRGVRCEYALEVLRNRELVREAGHKDVLGRPMLFVTTDEFLKVFGLTSLEQLPHQSGVEALTEQQEMAIEESLQSEKA